MSEKFKVKFKFKQDQAVYTPISEVEGIVDMLGYQDGIKKYYVITNDKGLENQWWKESLLVSAE